MSREEAIEILSDMRAEYNLFGDEEEATRYHVLSWAIQEMKADPVKHGRWVKAERHGCWSYADVYKQCSECGKVTFLAEKMNYCPNCGARMEGEEDE